MASHFLTKQYKVLASTHEKRLCYSKGQIWLEDAAHNKIKVKANLPKLAGYRLAERVLRLTPRLGFSLGEELFFSLHGGLFHVDEGNMEAHEVYQFRPGMNNPLTVCKRKQGEKEVVYWGEYWENPNHESVSVFKFDGNLITKVCTLSGIKHIHSIVWDRYRDCFWITTGDSDNESGIYRTSESFDCLEAVFSGRQTYRTCSLFPMEKGLLYATDSPLCSNSLLFSAEQHNRFLEPIIISSMPGPCIFSQEFREQIFFSTSVEPNPSQSTIKYWVSRKISPGNTDNRSHVICVTRDLEAREIFDGVKDIHNMFFFQYGNIQLSYDAYADALAGYCISLRKYDGQTIYLSTTSEK